ncbi:TonB-dependent receptor [Flavisolibacter sp. BT320]|nr:TonB-dependent receptor [Flavisolibacter longurius]
MACAATRFGQKRKFYLLALVFLCISQAVSAQDTGRIPVSGVVRDSSGAGMPMVTITEKGTQNVTTTGTDGSFSMTVANARSVLVITSIGYMPQEVTVGTQTNITVSLLSSNASMGEVVVIGYGSRRRESLTGAISTVTSKDLERVHAGATVSAGLAGKIPGVSFRMSDGRPGASANIQIRNMGSPLFVIDGIQQDAGQFNNIAPNDIESITVLKDGSAAIYGARAANGVVLVTTKRGRSGAPAVNIDAFYGMQNWVRFPDVLTSSYDYMRYKAEAEVNNAGSTSITPAELEKYKQGTELGYQSFDWRDFIIKPNAPLTSVNLNLTGGSEAVRYYISGTKLHQNSVLGREYKFDRTNIQSNIEARVTKGLKVGAQINGRIETRNNPGVPGGDDYWLPRFAILRNRPFERPYANDNPEYLNTIEQNDANWAYNTYKNAGKLTDEWRVLQANGEVEYQIPFIEGLTVRGMYSYYIADNLLNNQEFTYKTYTYRPATDVYEHTGGSINPWRERNQVKQINTNSQVQLSYNKAFGEHTVGATVANERISQQRRRNWVRQIPQSNVLPLIYFSTLADYVDEENREARIGYVARFSYSFANKYFAEFFGRRDASQIFRPEIRVGYFPGFSVGWRVDKESFTSGLFRGPLSTLKIRGSYGELGDDRSLPFGNFAYLPGYFYGSNGVSIISGQPVTVSRDRGIPITDFSWISAKTTDIGADFTMFHGKLTGTYDYFYRKRTGLAGKRYDLLLPNEIGYALPDENLNADAIFGHEGSLIYNGKARDLQFTIGTNLSYARAKTLYTYKPLFFNSWDKYRNSVEDRYQRIDWGYEVIGQFESQEQINNYTVNIDGQGNRTLLPGDLIYKDVNGDGKINGLDERPIGYGNANPNINFGLNFTLNWRGFDFAADFSGGAGFTWFQNWETRWPFQNGGNFNKIFEDRWHRADLYDVNSPWTPGKYPALRFNQGGHSNNNKTSTFWAHNVKYLRARTLQLGYSLSENALRKLHVKRARFYVNAYNLFSIDNLKQYGLDPEVADDNGLQFPQMKNINFGINLTF